MILQSLYVSRFISSYKPDLAKKKKSDNPKEADSIPEEGGDELESDNDVPDEADVDLSAAGTDIVIFLFFNVKVLHYIFYSLSSVETATTPKILPAPSTNTLVKLPCL